MFSITIKRIIWCLTFEMIKKRCLTFEMIMFVKNKEILNYKFLSNIF